VSTPMVRRPSLSSSRASCTTSCTAGRENNIYYKFQLQSITITAMHALWQATQHGKDRVHVWLSGMLCMFMKTVLAGDNLMFHATICMCQCLKDAALPCMPRSP
jgi:hypothetical protein